MVWLSNTVLYDDSITELYPMPNSESISLTIPAEELSDVLLRNIVLQVRNAQTLSPKLALFRLSIRYDHDGTICVDSKSV